MLPLSKKNKQKLEEHDGKLADTGWINLSLLNNWTTRSGQNVPSYCKKNGVVYLHGLIYAGDNVTERIFTKLPADIIPSGIITNLYFTTTAGGSSNREVNTLQIQKDGYVLAPKILTRGQWFPLDGISFPV